MLQAAVIAGVCALPTLIRAFLLNRTGAQESVTFFKTHYLQGMLQNLGLSTRLASLPLPAWFAASVSIYLFGSLGVRVIGIPTLLKDLLRPRSETPVRFLIATFVVIGAAIALPVSLVPKKLPGAYNNSIWFYADSKYVIWLFGVQAVQVWLRTRTRSIAQGAIVVAVGLMLSVPSAIQYFINLYSPWGSALLPEGAVEALEFLRVDSRPGEVVLSSCAEVVGPILSMTKCHVPIGPYAFDHVDRDLLWRRKSDWTSSGRTGVAVWLEARFFAFMA